MKARIFLILILFISLATSAQFPGTKISAMPTHSTSYDSAYIPVIISGVNKKIAGWRFASKTRLDSLIAASSSNPVVDTTTIYTNLNQRPILRTLTQLRSETNPPANAVYYVYDAGYYGFFKYDAADVTSADDTATTIVVGTKRFKRQIGKIIYPEWWGAKGDANAGISGTNDAPAFNAMFRWMERQARGSYEIGFLHTDYYISSRITLPYSLGTLPGNVSPFLKINASGVTIKTDQAIDMIYRMPATDADVGAMNDKYKLVIEGITLQGDRVTTGQTAMRISCFYGAEFKNMVVTGADTGVVAHFFTKSKFTNCFFGVNQKVDLILKSLYQLVGTQTVAGSASNTNTIENCRFYEYTGAYAAIMLWGTDNTVINHYVIEGAQPRYGIFSDHQNSTVINSLYINDGWFEGTGGSASVNFRIAGSGTTTIANVQRTYADTLFDLTGSASGAIFVFDRMYYAGGMANVPFVVDASNPTMSGQSIYFYNSEAFSTLINTPAKWSGGVVPQNIFFPYFQGGNGGYTVPTSNGHIEMQPNADAPEGDGNFLIRGNQWFKTDNINSFGGTLNAANRRPIVGYFGTSGVFVDNTGRFKFGSATTTPDVSIARDSAGRLSILDNTSNFRDLKLQTATLTGQVYASALATSTTVADSAVVRNAATGKFEMRKLPTVGTLDATPTDGSTNGVESNGVFDALATKQGIVSGVSDTEIGYLDGATSAIQSQIDAKVPTSRTITIAGAGSAQDLSANRTFYPKTYFQQAIEALGSSVKGQSVGVNMDQMSSSSFTAVDGTAYWTAVWLPSPETLTGIKFWLGAQGSFTGDNFNGFALYTYSGGTLTQVAISANDETIWKGTASSYQSVPFTSTYSASAGLYFVAFVFNASATTTAPTFGISASVTVGGMQSGDFTNSAKLNSTQATQTSLSATKAMSSLTVTTLRPWIGLY